MEPGPPMVAAGGARVPGTVTAATGLLLVAAAALVTDGAVGLAYAAPVTDAFRQAYEGVPGADFSVLSIGFTAGVLLVAGAGLAVLAWFDRRGSRFARLQTWMLGAVLLCWGGSSLVAEPGQPRNLPDPDELDRLLDQAMPGWAEAVTAGTMPVAVGALLPALVLLALPPSRRHFRPALEAPDAEAPDAEARDPAAPDAESPAPPTGDPPAGSGGPPPAPAP